MTTSKELLEGFPWLAGDEPVSGADVTQSIIDWYHQLKSKEEELERPLMSDDVRDHIRESIFGMFFECESDRDVIVDRVQEEIGNLTDESLMGRYLEMFGDTEREVETDIREDEGERMAHAIFQSEAYKRYWSKEAK